MSRKKEERRRRMGGNKLDARAKTTAEIKTRISDDSFHTSWKGRDFGQEARVIDNLIKPGLIKLHPKCDVVLDRASKNPGDLAEARHLAQSDQSALNALELTLDGEREGTLAARRKAKKRCQLAPAPCKEQLRSHLPTGPITDTISPAQMLKFRECRRTKGVRGAVGEESEESEEES